MVTSVDEKVCQKIHEGVDFQLNRLTEIMEKNQEQFLSLERRLSLLEGKITMASSIGGIVGGIIGSVLSGLFLFIVTKGL